MDGYGVSWRYFTFILFVVTVFISVSSGREGEGKLRKCFFGVTKWLVGNLEIT